MTTITTYKTTDGQKFNDQEKAQAHQDNIDAAMEKRVSKLVWEHIGIGSSIGDTIKALLADQKAFKKALTPKV